MQEKERQEKKLAKVEKERKEKEAQSKSRSLMATFFGKPKAPVATGSGSRSTSIPQENSQPVQSEPREDKSRISDYERTFKSFLLKKGAELAPHNWFLEVRSGKKQQRSDVDDKTVIVIDDDEPQHDAQMDGACNGHVEDVEMQDVPRTSSRLDRGQMTAQGISSSRTARSRLLNQLQSVCAKSSAACLRH